MATSRRCGLGMLGRVDEAIALLKEKEPSVQEQLGKMFMISLRLLLEGNRDASLQAIDERFITAIRDPEGGILHRQAARLFERRRPGDPLAE